MTNILPPTLFMPPLPGQLTTLSNMQYVPWSDDDTYGFTVHTLGQRLRAKRPVTKWLAQFNLQLLKYNMPEDSFGQLYALLTPEWRKAAGYRLNQAYFHLSDSVQRGLDTDESDL